VVDARSGGCNATSGAERTLSLDGAATSHRGVTTLGIMLRVAGLPSGTCSGTGWVGALSQVRFTADRQRPAAVNGLRASRFRGGRVELKHQLSLGREGLR
jgi:hypothetical protein